MNMSRVNAVWGDEHELVQGLKNANDQSFEFMVREYGGYLMTIARRYLQSEADVQDCVQESFIHVFRSVSNFEGRSSLKSWLHRIVVNAALSKIRAQGRRHEDLVDDSASLFYKDGSRIETESEITKSSELEAISKETMSNVREKIRQLPDLPRNLLLLRDIEGYSTAEVEKMLGISNSAVKTGLHRARRALKQSILA